MHTTEVYFEGQREVISRHILAARSFILVAMAWFTDKTLFELLLKKAQEGVQVLVLIHDDEINTTSDIPYTKLNDKNSELFLIADSKKIMHHKFCVIDCNTVLHGSYNWTYQAIKNHENLSVTEGDIHLAASFIMQFFKIKKAHTFKKEPAKNEASEPATILGTRRTSQRSNRTLGILEKMKERRRQAALRDGKGNDPMPDDNAKPAT